MGALMNAALVKNAYVANEEWRKRIGLAMLVKRVCMPVREEEPKELDMPITWEGSD